MKKQYDPELIEIIKSKVSVWEQAENRAKQYLQEARNKKRQALRQLRKEENRK